VPEIPSKQYYRLSEVCQYTDTQPYVLRFWESEFPQLSPERGRTGQPVYRRRDIDTVLHIKQMLHEESETIAGARERLERGGGKNRRPVRSTKKAGAKRPKVEMALDRPRPVQSIEPPPPAVTATQESLGSDSVARDRYEDALEEITHLRLELHEAQTLRRKAEAAVGRIEETEAGLAEWRQRSESAAAILDELLARLE
jgi:DNA-binding transcriptional MerR regulator